MQHPLFPKATDPVELIRFMTRIGHSRAVVAAYHDHGSDWCELALPYDRELVSDEATGILASGPIFTIMDMATSISIWLKTGQVVPQATLDLRIDYLRAAEPGATVIGRGECYHASRSVAFVRGIAHDGDSARPIAHVAGTYFFTES